ncbi:hypothetical protein E4P42_00165 [Mycobacterium sp. PS03-16]|uniref:hypothetical protein n=1 Tax=Mycobacterium sp. PS03-16 TaxID=2559611 RepID=UPI0010737CB8|nr:hypothetical protein [Mycobacterium sp. PS03-16]TFV61355.1 hypothetical protein E4P42_00165 [Mycobacterium sp. PS03-16]
MTASPTPSRPRVVEIAFWVLITGAVLLIVGGLIAATVSFETARSAIDPAEVSNEQLSNYLTVYRGMGIGAVLAGGGLAFTAGRSRRGDAKFRRATVGLSLAIAVVLLLLVAGAGVGQPVTLLSLLPIAIGTVLLTRPAAAAYFGRDGGR